MMRRSYFVIILLLFAAIVGLKGQSGRPDFTRNGGSMPMQAMEMETDTVKKPPLEFKYTLLSNLYMEYTDMDTSLNTVHLTDPYYRQEFAGGTLGSDLSAGYRFQYQGPSKGLQLGQEVHPLLSNLPEQRIVHTNRPYFVVDYGVAQAVRRNVIQPIKGADFGMKFYKSFAKNIALNFSYQSNTDQRANADQDVRFKRLALNLLQKSKSGKRTSYVVYNNPRYFDTYLDRDDGVLGNIENARRKVVLGNSLIFRDSSDQQSIFPRWDSQLTFGKEAYRITDSGVQSEELALFPYQFDSLSLTSIQYQNEISTLTFTNSYHAEIMGGEAMGGIEISQYSWTGLDTLGASLYPILIKGAYVNKNSPYLKYRINGRVGIVEASGDMGIEGRGKYVVGASRIEASLVGERLLPRLSQRGIFLNDTRAQVYTNSFDPMGHMGLKVKLEIPKFKSFVQFQLDNYIDLILPNLSGQFEQEGRSTRIVSLEGQTQVKFGPFSTEHRLIFQNIDNTKLRRPELQYFGKLFFELNLFKKRMKSQWGTEVYFTPSFQTPTFWPILGEFGYSPIAQKSGRLLIVNPYLNLQVDKFYFFVKSVNLMDMIQPSIVTWVDGYRFSGNRIRFGLRWRLLD